MPLLWAIGGLLIVALGWVALTFNRLIRNGNRVDAAWSLIDVELQRRYNLVPRLADAVRGYAAHEQALFERVANARADAVRAGDVEAHARADTALTDTLRSLFVVSEAYPQLQASEQFLALHAQLTEAEDRIAYARGYYNVLVVEYELVRQRIPTNLVAAAFRFSLRRSFEADVDSRVALRIDATPPAERSP